MDPLSRGVAASLSHRIGQTFPPPLSCSFSFCSVSSPLSHLSLSLCYGMHHPAGGHLVPSCFHVSAWNAGRPVPLLPRTPTVFTSEDLWRVHSFIKILFKFRLSRRRAMSRAGPSRGGTAREGAVSGFICVARRERERERLILPTCARLNRTRLCSL